LRIEDETLVRVDVLLDEEQGLDGLVLDGLNGVDGLVLDGLDGVDGLVLNGLNMPLEIEDNAAEALLGDDGRTKAGTGDGLLLCLVLDGALSNGSEVIFLAELTTSAAFSFPLEETGLSASFVEFLRPLLAASVKGIPLEGENPRAAIDKEADL